EGRGTPAPIAPPERLVGGGVYRHVRNPMYVAVGGTIVGETRLAGGAGGVVVGGMYRHVRNPMYVAVGATIVGQTLLLGRPWLLAYAGAFWLVVAGVVRGYQERTLSGRYGGGEE